MSYIFDGREYARQKELMLSGKVAELHKQKIVPKLVSIIVGDDPASVLYANLKKRRAEAIGCELEVVKKALGVNKAGLVEEIGDLNKRSEVHGIMVQLPLPRKFSKKDRTEIINSIAIDKDVDGLRLKSNFIPPTANAVCEILTLAKEVIHFRDYPVQVAVVGASGFIGHQIVNELVKSNDYKVTKADSRTKDLKSITHVADVVISVTGVPNLIKKDMVKDKTVLIDVGSPQGDVEKSAYEKAVFVSPVPGGVGPVTISCLLENLVNSVKI